MFLPLNLRSNITRLENLKCTYLLACGLDSIVKIVIGAIYLKSYGFNSCAADFSGRW